MSRAKAQSVIVLFILLLPLPSAAKEIGPGADFCAEINGLGSGEELVLAPGTYRGPCTIRRGGKPGAPIVIRSGNSASPARIAYDGRSDNVINVRADHVTIRGVKIGPTQPDVDGIRIYARGDVTVEDCRFEGMGGIAVVANHNSASGFVVSGNTIINASATAMYFGCHDGNSCAISDLRVENNFISGITAPDPEVGYGIQVKLNSYGIIRDNVVVDTKGPGIMVYGATEPGKRSLIERNFVSGSRTSAGIVVGGGPAAVRNNIAVRNREAGITLQDYGSRGLLRGLAVAYNTLYSNEQAGIKIAAHSAVDAILAYNVVAPASGLPKSSDGGAGVAMVGNQGCTQRCFADPDRLDFTPADESLITRVPARSVGDAPAEDYFGRPRSAPATAGAVEKPGGIITLGIKP